MALGQDFSISVLLTFWTGWCFVKHCRVFNLILDLSVQFSSFQSLSHVEIFVTPWTVACQASLSITNSQNLLKLKSIESVMLSNPLILCYPLILLPSIFPSIRVFSNESALYIRWPKYWSFSLCFSISPSNEYSGLISFRIDWFDLLSSKGLSRVFSNTTVQKHPFFRAQFSLWSKFHSHVSLLEKPYLWLVRPFSAK